MSEEFKIDPTINYDVVSLPSNGIYYSTRKKTLRVAYLTAADENILSSSNLISSLSVIDELLKRKILDKDFDVNELVEEDRQAILIFLRNTGFGSTYTITTNDTKTNQVFKTEIDLSTLKIKEFTLTEDSNGEYPYYMEKSKTSITFKFLTRFQIDELEKMEKSWKGDGVVPIKTKELEMMIKSVNGNRDPMFIYQFINNKLPIKDSQDFRKFVEKNKPGLDLLQEIKTPSGEIIQAKIGFGAEFFRPFYGI